MIAGISKSRIWPLIEAGLVLSGICVFAWFIHSTSVQRVIALIALGAAAVVISLSVPGIRSLLHSLGLAEFSKKTVVYSLAGLSLGVLLALRCRSIFNVSLLPQTLTVAALVAPLIGVCEELLFRGYLQGKLSNINIYVAIIVSSFGHTLYKYLVLRSLPTAIGIDFLSLVVFTFIAGIVCGVSRVLSKSIIPACVTHGIFDALVYGGLSTWPVWVWN